MTVMRLLAGSPLCGHDEDFDAFANDAGDDDDNDDDESVQESRLAAPRLLQ